MFSKGKKPNKHNYTIFPAKQVTVLRNLPKCF